MGLTISLIIMLPVIVFWSLVTFDILKEKGNKKKKVLAVLFLFLLMASPLFSEYRNSKVIERYEEETKCGDVEHYNTDFETFLLTEANNNSILDITKRDEE